MKLRIATVVLMTTALIGCGEKALPQADEAPAAPVEAQPGSSPAAAIEQPLPAGIVLPESFQLRNVMERQTEKGESRNRSVYEFVEGDNAAAFETVKQVLVNADFKDGEVKQTESSISATFRKSGYGRIQVSVSSTVGKKPRIPQAKGVVSLDWPAANTSAAATN